VATPAPHGAVDCRKWIGPTARFMVTHDVEEALHMAGRVLVLSQRPAWILAEIAVDLPHPRHRGSPRFGALRHRVLEELGLQAHW